MDKISSAIKTHYVRDSIIGRTNHHLVTRMSRHGEFVDGCEWSSSGVGMLQFNDAGLITTLYMVVDKGEKLLECVQKYEAAQRGDRDEL